MDPCQNCGAVPAANVYSLGGLPVDPDMVLTQTGDLEDDVVVAVLCQECFAALGVPAR